MLAHLFTHSKSGCNAFLGGISKNYHTNLLLSKNPVLVAEADEFDRSFLQLFPDVAVITSTDADHLDIYGTHEAVKEAFPQIVEVECTVAKIAPPLGGKIDKVSVTLIG